MTSLIKSQFARRSNDMKFTLLLLLTIGALSATAGQAPALSFPDKKIEMPALSIAESTRQQLTSRVFGNTDFVARVEPAPTSVPVRRVVSHMPIIQPAAGTDAAMIQTPDARVDYKLAVKDPGVESVK